MSQWLTVIYAALQVFLLVLKAYYAKDDDVKKLHADKINEISSAVSSGDESRINSVIMGLRH